MFAKYKKSKAKPYPPSADATLIQRLKPLAFPSLCRKNHESQSEKTYPQLLEDKKVIHAESVRKIR
jgi:hypothetical protein